MASLAAAALTTIMASSTGEVQEAAPAAKVSPSATGSTSPRSVWSGVYTEAQARRGEDLYFTHCVLCHGELLEGNGPATPLTGSGFSANWDGQSLGDMLERTRLTMPVNNPGKLSRQQVADLLAFVLEANRFPAGEGDLPRQAQMLNQIKFLAAKP